MKKKWEVRLINILICGEYGAFTVKLISRLRQEKHDIFVITGRSWNTEKKVAGVFQEYNFEYNSNGVVNIIHNVKPDIVIFMGALDEHFEWRSEKQQSGEYISGLTNILIASLNAGVRRFLYCSSLEIYEDNDEVEIKKDTVPVPCSIKAKTFIQGEDTCKYYNQPGVFDISIIRFSEMYGSFMGRYMLSSYSNRLMRDAMADKEIVIQWERTHNLIYLDDGVEALYRIIVNRAEKTAPIHVFGHSCKEKEMIDYIRQFAKKEIKIKEDIEDKKVVKEKVWKKENLETIEGFQCKFTLEEGIQKFLLSDINEEKRKATKRKSRNKILGSKTGAILETIILTSLAGIITHYAKDTLAVQYLDFYLLIVVLISAIHGSVYGIIAVMISVISKFASVIALGGTIALITDFGVYLWTLQLLIVGGIVSFTSDLYKRKFHEISEEKEYIEDELKDMNRINDSNVYVKNIYEKRLINYKNSLAKIYDITSMLDHLSVQKIIFQAADVVMQFMEAKEVAIYMSGDNSSYLRLMASTSLRARKMGKSVQIDENHIIRKGIEEEGYYRNKELNPDYPMLAGAVTEGEHIRTLIMVWDIKIEGANLYQANLLAVLCKLIEKSMRQAQTYMDAIKDDTYLEGSRALKKESFSQIVSIYKEGSEKKLLEYALLRVISIDDEIDLNQVIQAVEKKIRLSDYLGLGEDGHLYLLLTNSSEHDIKIVTERLEKINLSSEVVENG